MDFIERIFQVSLDGGTGLWELAFVLGLMAIPLMLGLRRRARWTARTLPLKAVTRK
jgi:hypothetical protein